MCHVCPAQVGVPAPGAGNVMAATAHCAVRLRFSLHWVDTCDGVCRSAMPTTDLPRTYAMHSCSGLLTSKLHLVMYPWQRVAPAPNSCTSQRRLRGSRVTSAPGVGAPGKRMASPGGAWHPGARRWDHRHGARRSPGAALPATPRWARSSSPGACRRGASGRRRDSPLGRCPPERPGTSLNGRRATGETCAHVVPNYVIHSGA